MCLFSFCIVTNSIVVVRGFQHFRESPWHKLIARNDVQFLVVLLRWVCALSVIVGGEWQQSDICYNDDEYWKRHIMTFFVFYFFFYSIGSTWGPRMCGEDNTTHLFTQCLVERMPSFRIIVHISAYVFFSFFYTEWKKINFQRILICFYFMFGFLVGAYACCVYFQIHVQLIGL